MKKIFYFFVLPCVVIGILCFVTFDFQTLNRHFQFYQCGIKIDSVAEKECPAPVVQSAPSAVSEYQKTYEKETTTTSRSTNKFSGETPENKLKSVANKTIIDNNVRAAQSHQSDGFSDVHYEDDVMQQEVVSDIVAYLNSKGPEAQVAVQDLQNKGVDGLTVKQKELLLQLLREQP